MIDTSTWKKYILGDLFDMQRGTGYGLKDLVEGNTPLISATTKKNSIVAYANVTPKFDAETITITTDGAGMGYATVQMKPFDIASNAVAVLPYDNNVGLYAKFFVCAVIRQYANRFSYKDKMNRDRLLQLEVYLPATSDGQPDWNYMESYMKAVMEESEKSLENLKKADDTKHLIDVSGWGEFRVGDLFDIHPTKAYKLTNAQLLDDGNYPVIANSAYNNGIGGYSTRKPTEQGNMVTFSDTVDANTIFYQKEPFVGYPHVQGLYPIKYEDKWNELTYQFFVSVFRGTALVKGFDYGNKFRRDIAVELMVKLPITSTGEPDWQYMEDYMKQIMDKSEQIVSDLQIGA